VFLKDIQIHFPWHLQVLKKYERKLINFLKYLHQLLAVMNQRKVGILRQLFQRIPEKQAVVGIVISQKKPDRGRERPINIAN